MIKLIVAVDNKNGIASEGKIPWHCPEDLKHFRKKTRGKTLVVGRKTYETLPKLPGRKLIIMSRTMTDSEWPICRNVEQVIDNTDNDELYIIGGAQIYRQFLDSGRVDKVILSRIPGDFECDQVFPKLSWKKWTRIKIKKMKTFQIETWTQKL